MLIYTKKSELLQQLESLKKQGLKLGFVPTMGALHPGHVSLIHASQLQCNYTVCSIFVNPTQFNDKSDLDRYPRTPESDIKMLENAKCDLLFMPSVDEMYHDLSTTAFDLGYLNQILEAAHRPGHFDGVAQVVYRFFQIVQPHIAFFGSKDYQQVMVVKKMVELSKLPVKVVSCPIVRENDGLAMSSRNTLLSANERRTASKIPLLMSEAASIAKKHSVGAAKLHVIAAVNDWPNCKLDYYEVADAENLQPLSHLPAEKPAVSLIALFVGKIRLIDNLMLS